MIVFLEGDGGSVMEQLFRPLIACAQECEWHTERCSWEGRLREACRHSAESPVLLLVQAPHQATKRLHQWLDKEGLVRGPGAGGHLRIVEVELETNPAKITRKGKRVKQLWDRSYDSVVLGHPTTGGVIAQDWTFKFNFPLAAKEREDILRQSSVRSVIQDYLSPTEKGTPVKGEVDRGGLPPDIPWKRSRVTCLAPSVFAESGWVRRHLTMKELLDAYDVSVADRQLMLETMKGEDDNRPFPSAFVHQAPVRVLGRVLEVVKLGREGPTSGHNVAPGELDRRRGSADREPTTGGPHSWRGLDELEGELTHQEVARRAAEPAGPAMRAEEPGGQDKGGDHHQQAKNDDAGTNVREWNERVCRGLKWCVYNAEVHDRALDALRSLLLKYFRSWQGPLWRSFRRYLALEYGEGWRQRVARARAQRRRCSRSDQELLADVEVGVDAIGRAVDASFWEWDRGSTIFFWRWTPEYRRDMRDGFAVWCREADLPNYWGCQTWPDDDIAKARLKEKIVKVIKRGYIKRGFVKSLTGFFAVPKGTEDIRVVYDATKSGLNAAIWSPNFYLPNATTVLNTSDESTFYGDIDLGEMFLNYFLDPKLRARAGVDVTELAPELGEELKPGQRLYMRWERALMGVRSSPFNCVRAFLLSEDIIKGDRCDPANPFRWDTVILNLPGTSKYDPGKPWIYKYDSKTKKIAAFVISYVDDLRAGDHGSAERCDHITHVTASRINYLGQQDATRKRRGASQEPGPWAGSVLVSKAGDGLYLTISQEKWDKVKNILTRYASQLGIQDGSWELDQSVWLDYKTLERDTGFLVHVMMTFENLRPYLKGFYLTMNGWRFDRNTAGWKRNREDWMAQVEAEWGDPARWEDYRAAEANRQEGEGIGAPNKVKALEQLFKDVAILSEMFQRDAPTQRLIRGRKIGRIMYGFGDASGAGFGASWCTLEGGDLTSPGASYRFGRWGNEGEGTTSNYRELRNLVDTLDELGKKGELKGAEVFIFTDNSTAESAFCRGSSSSPELFLLVKRLKLLEMLSLTRIHITHVAGKRMIRQGTDGLSRGCLSDGVMAGNNMLSFVPLHQTALDRSSALLRWLQQHCEGRPGREELRVLEPTDWYERGQDIVGGEKNQDGIWTPTYRAGTFVWAPPPCIASQCLEELRRSRHKRQQSTHLFVCPRIMSSQWLRQLYRSADIILQIPAGHTAWPVEQHEPVFLGIYFPFLSHEPWQLKGTPKILGMGGHLQRLCKTDASASGPLLRKLWDLTCELPNMPQLVVQRLLQGHGATDLPSTAPGKRRRTGMAEG